MSIQICSFQSLIPRLISPVCMPHSQAYFPSMYASFPGLFPQYVCLIPRLISPVCMPHSQAYFPSMYASFPGLFPQYVCLIPRLISPVCMPHSQAYFPSMYASFPGLFPQYVCCLQDKKMRRMPGRGGGGGVSRSHDWNAHLTMLVGRRMQL